MNDQYQQPQSFAVCYEHLQPGDVIINQGYPRTVATRSDAAQPWQVRVDFTDGTGQGHWFNRQDYADVVAGPSYQARLTPAFPPSGSANPQLAAPKRKHPVAKTLGVIAAVFAGLILVGVAVGGESGDPTTATTPATPGPSGPSPKPTVAEAEEEQPPAPTYAEPKATDFELTVKVLEKECFGSAGCNLTYRITVGSKATADYDPAKTYELTYDVKGGDDPQINTLTITGGEYETDQEEFIQTPKSSVKLTAAVTSVEEL